MTETANAAMAEYWNQSAGPVWVAMQAQLDRQTEPLGRAAMRALDPNPGERVLDIGCGCGQTAWELAAAVGPSGQVAAVDISAPMLEFARTRGDPSASARPSFRLADAQTADLGAAEFDAAFSRFGVMFFADPAAAFGNIAKALKLGGRLAFVCWRPYAENPLMRAPAEAAAAFLPPVAPPDPTAPGPFAYADPARVRAILGDAGFSDIAVEPYDTKVGGADLEGALALALRVGPLGAAIRENPSLVDRVAPVVRGRLADYLTPEGVMLPAAVWIVTARV
ncbi:MAG: class I SAM-dependent methyltransferase [Caulobacteraceae bacterium]